MPDDGFERWTALLDRLERDAARAGDLGDVPTWRPPSGLGPIPPELVGRAQALALRQADAIVAVEASKQATGRHLAAVRAVPPGRENTRPVYLDLNG